MIDVVWPIPIVYRPRDGTPQHVSRTDKAGVELPFASFRHDELVDVSMIHVLACVEDHAHRWREQSGYRSIGAQPAGGAPARVLRRQRVRHAATVPATDAIRPALVARGAHPDRNRRRSTAEPSMINEIHEPVVEAGPGELVLA